MVTHGNNNDPNNPKKVTAVKANHATKVPPRNANKHPVPLGPSNKNNIDQQANAKNETVRAGRVAVAVGARYPPESLLAAVSVPRPNPYCNGVHEAMSEYANSIDENTGKAKDTDAYIKRCAALELAFIESVTVQQVDTIPLKLRELVKSHPLKPAVPLLFHACAGATPDLGQRKCVSKATFRFFADLKPARNSGLSDYQPQTLMCMVRSFFAHMKDNYDWNYTYQKDFKFEGGLIPALDDLIKRRKKLHGVEYGVEKKKSVLKGGSKSVRL